MPVENDLHGPSGLESRERGVSRYEGGILLLASERAPRHGLHDPDPALLPAETLDQGLVYVVRALHGPVNRDPVPIADADHSLRLHVGLFLEAGLPGPLENVRGLSERLLGVPLFYDVLREIVESFAFSLEKNGLEVLVLHLYAGKEIEYGPTVLPGQEQDGLPHVPHLVLGEEGLVVHQYFDPVHAGHVPRVDYVVTFREIGNTYIFYTRVRPVGPERSRMEHPLETEVVQVPGSASGFLPRIHPCHRSADRFMHSSTLI